MLNDIYVAADNRLKTILLQLDLLSSAFDTIAMCTPLRRLRHTFGVSGQAPCQLSPGASFSVSSSQIDAVAEVQMRVQSPTALSAGPSAVHAVYFADLESNQLTWG